MADSNLMQGSCHCGRITFSFLSSVPPEKYSPRACDCSFCQRHGALYISDQNGSVVLDIKEADALGEYRFGHKLGKFVFCRNCGVFVAVLFETDGRMFGSVNSRCIEGNVKFGDFEIISPQKLEAEQKKKEKKERESPAAPRGEEKKERESPAVPRVRVLACSMELRAKGHFNDR